ncbi:hypothetical protein A4X13_0g8763 [Tilletia indica]|uniref:Nucleotidyl transferase domain-containing protein n=1 Tax=Tilletia indica TaxID=43049 RepID=A0A177TWD1_9BASI|nr:hypothetical protein A4X13_0g8763 [Tilletia indica]
MSVTSALLDASGASGPASGTSTPGTATPSAPSASSSSNAAYTLANSTSSQSAGTQAVPTDVLTRLLQGVTDMQSQMTRLHSRIDSLEASNYALLQQQQQQQQLQRPGSPALRPNAIQRMNSQGGLSGSYSPLASPATTPSAGSAGFAPHLSLASSVLAQPAPVLASSPSTDMWCVVPAGGAGTRLWPLSRESYPKFLLDLTGTGRTLLQSTWDRLLPLCGTSRMMIVTGSAHVGGVGAQLPELSEANLLAEPSPKESMAAIGLAAAVLKRRDPEAVLGSFAADHIISGRDAFETAVTEAVETAKAGYLVTIGIAPSHPSTGFGYIKLGEKLNLSAAPNARRVTEFKEKPDARTASAYLATGQYRWNGGMFVVQAKTLLSLLQQSMPALHDGLEQIAAAWDTPQRASILSEIWPKLDKIAIDHAVAEPAAKAGRVAVVPATFGWDDVGDFASLADLLPSEKGEACVLGDARLVVAESQAGGLIIPAAGRPIACLGVDDVVVVDTPDALLVTTRARSQEVKKIVARCKKQFPSLC